MIWITVSMMVLSVLYALTVKLSYANKVYRLEIELENRIEKEIIYKIKENERIAGHLIIQATAIEEHRKLNTRHFNEIIQLSQDVRDQRSKVLAIHNDNVALLAKIREEIKDNKQQQFYVKESTVLLYDHYKKIVEILNSLLMEPGYINYEAIVSLLQTSNNNMNTVKDYFVRNFNVVPEKYVDQKINMGGVKPNGSEWQSNFSKN